MKNGPYELIVAPPGYPGKRYRGRYAYEHHVIWWETTGSIVKKGFEIHHINGNHRDNRISNLSLLTSDEHKKIHCKLKSEKSTLTITCVQCEKKFNILKSDYEWKIKRNTRGYICCSRSCGNRKPKMAGEVGNSPTSSALTVQRINCLPLAN